MKKVYENVKIEWTFLSVEDIVRTSQNDNVEDLPEFPENFSN